MPRFPLLRFFHGKFIRFSTFGWAHATDTPATEHHRYIIWQLFFFFAESKRGSWSSRTTLSRLLLHRRRTKKSINPRKKKLFSDFFGHKNVCDFFFGRAIFVETRSLRNSCSGGSFHSLVLLLALSILEFVCSSVCVCVRVSFALFLWKLFRCSLHSCVPFCGCFQTNGKYVKCFKSILSFRLTQHHMLPAYRSSHRQALDAKCFATFVKIKCNVRLYGGAKRLPHR